VRRALSGLAAMLAPAPALACAACAAGSDSNRVFFIMTMVMSVLPLLLIGAGLWWIARHARERLQGEFEERDSLPIARAEPEATPGPAGPHVPGVVTGR
jgi:hypothetical protein